MVKVKVSSDKPITTQTDFFDLFEEEIQAFHNHLQGDSSQDSSSPPIQPFTNYERWFLARYLKFRLQNPAEE